MAVIYLKTLAGQTALHSRAVNLTPRQRSAFIMFDGKRSLDDVLKLTAGIGVTPADVDQLVTLDLLEAAQTAAPASAPTPAFSASTLQPAALPSVPAPSSVSLGAAGAPNAEAQATYLKAYPIATRLTADLGFRGFRLNLAVEKVGDLQQLRELASRIRDAVGAEKFKSLEDALR